ncbi:Cytochrome c oxidase subunit 5B, mitochondrial [Melia azedarach]|uniref:Cytochrome c oxidase subunit 5B, mitochondrial n=2 Tax=Melia azedarach TaxID=155640 RepID=A0ACC1Y533_MELAZ|nr:Cytochrome c oxidase subunit 5B, mitochondrial [Melia azedarach]KAJ4718318.1 Cytochrome c oxidase subunit 5B, mitochondrial [Melia azedarach]
MWRRICSSQFKAQALAAVAQSSCRSTSINPSIAHSASRSLTAPSLFASRHFSVDAGTAVKKTVEDVMPIATGHEREEIEAALQGREILDTDHPVGPFGTKEAPAVIKAYYDKRIVGCSGGEGEDEHDVVWFWLEKDKPHECPVCSQYFVLEVVGPGGSPDGHDDDDHHH